MFTRKKFLQVSTKTVFVKIDNIFLKTIDNSGDAKPRIFEDVIRDAFNEIIAALPDDPEIFEVLNIASKDTLFE